MQVQHCFLVILILYRGRQLRGLLVGSSSLFISFPCDCSKHQNDVFLCDISGTTQAILLAELYEFSWVHCDDLVFVANLLLLILGGVLFENWVEVGLVLMHYLLYVLSFRALSIALFFLWFQLFQALSVLRVVFVGFFTSFLFLCFLSGLLAIVDLLWYDSFSSLLLKLILELFILSLDEFLGCSRSFSLLLHVSFFLFLLHPLLLFFSLLFLDFQLLLQHLFSLHFSSLFLGFHFGLLGDFWLARVLLYLFLPLCLLDTQSSLYFLLPSLESGLPLLLLICFLLHVLPFLLDEPVFWRLSKRSAVDWWSIGACLGFAFVLLDLTSGLSE